MKRILKISVKILGGLILLLFLVYLGFWIKWKIQASSHMDLAGEEAPTLPLTEKLFGTSIRMVNWISMKIKTLTLKLVLMTYYHK